MTSPNVQKLTTVSHPQSGKTMTGAEIIVQVLADQGVDVIFGYSGGAILPTYDAVFRYNAKHQNADGKEPMPLIVPANEQGAGFELPGPGCQAYIPGDGSGKARSDGPHGI